MADAMHPQNPSPDPDTPPVPTVSNPEAAGAEHRRAHVQPLVHDEVLRLALSGSNIGLYDLDLDAGTAQVTPGYATQLGFDPATFTLDLRHWADMLHPDDRDRVVALLEACIAGDTPGYDTEYRIRTRTGAWKWVQSVGRTITSASTGKPERLLGIHADINERRRTEAVLLESRWLYEDLVSSVPMGVYRVAPTEHGSFTFIYASDTYCQTIGLPREVILADARATVEIIHPEDRQEFDQLNRDAIGRLAPFNWEGRVLVHGETRWLHVESHPSWSEAGQSTWTGVVMDVTDRKHAERALRESEYFLARSQEVTRLGSYSVDIPNRTWSGTRTLDDIFGIDAGYPRTLEGWLALVVPEHREEMKHHLLEHVIAGRNRFEHEYRIVRQSDREPRWMFGLGELEFDAGGEPVRLIGTVQDITDRKRAEEERLELERRLLQAQKLESLGVLAGGIAHDFNNLLMAMLGNLDLALTQLSPVSPSRASIDQAVVAARRAADLTRQMLAYSGKASFDVRAMDLNELVEENAHLFRACIPKVVTLKLNLGRDIHAIVADAGQVQQLIMNLITNAAEAIGDQAGFVTLATGEQDYSAAELYRSRLEEIPLPGRFVHLEVSDTGCGMDTRTLQRLFDPFFTTKVMGRGLGMSAILGIVRGHQGAILVDSAPGTGSTIRVLFPASTALAARGNGQAAQAAPADAKLDAGAILVVDDEEMVRNVCRRMLQQHGWNVLEADGGPAAIEVFRARAAEIACVVLDLSMPQMDGFAVFRTLRAIKPDVRVILTSGYSRHHEPGRDLAAEGFAGFIQKPYSAKALRDEVSRVVAGA